MLVDDSGQLDVGDRSFPAFWLPFQDVTAHNFSAQWVEQVSNNGSGGNGGSSSGGASGGGGASNGGDASNSGGTSNGGSRGGGGMCGVIGTPCGAGFGLCCSNTICCGTACTDYASCVK